MATARRNSVSGAQGADVAGPWCRQVLACVLSSDSLDLDSELVAYLALAKWVLADRERRLPSFHALFGADLLLSLSCSVCGHALVTTFTQCAAHAHHRQRVTLANT